MINKVEKLAEETFKGHIGRRGGSREKEREREGGGLERRTYEKG